MALEESQVFRQLEKGGRLSQLDLVDAATVLVSYQLHFMVEFFLGGNLLRPWVTLVAVALAMYFLRARLPEGVTPILHVLSTPRHLSSLAPDIIVKPYPAVPRGADTWVTDVPLAHGDRGFTAGAANAGGSIELVCAEAEARRTRRPGRPR